MLAVFACRGYRQKAQTPVCLNWAAYPGDSATMAWCWPQADTGARVIDGKLVQAKNEVDCLTFTLYPDNPGYDYMNEYGTLVYAVDSDEPETAVFAGRVISISPFSEPTGATGKDVTCEGGLGFMRDVNYGVSASSLAAWPKAYTLLDNLGKRYNAGIGIGSGNWNILGQTGISASDVLFVIHKHISFDLSAISSSSAGHGLSEMVASSSLDIFTNVCNNNNWVMLYERTLPQDANGFFEATNYVTVKPNGSAGDTRGIIEIGTNLGASSYDASMSSPATFGYAYDLSSGQNGFAGSGNAEDYRTYGVITGGVSYNDGLTHAQVESKAKSLISTKFDYSIAVTALDLSYIDESFDRFKLLDRWTVKNDLIGLNQVMQIVKRTVDLDQPWTSSIEFGNKTKSASQQQAATSSAVNMTGDNAVAISVFDGTSSGVVPAPSSSSSSLVLSAAGTWVSVSGGGGATDYDQLTGRPLVNGVTLTGDKSAEQLGFAEVATSGSYNDLGDKPSIPSYTVFTNTADGLVPAPNAVSGIEEITLMDADGSWSTLHDILDEMPNTGETNVGFLARIYAGSGSNYYWGRRTLNKDDIPRIDASKIGSGTLDAARMPDLGGTYATRSSLAAVATSGDYGDLSNRPAIPTQAGDIGAQEELVSGANIKTVNGQSLLGSGNVEVSGGSGGSPAKAKVFIPDGASTQGTLSTSPEAIYYIDRDYGGDADVSAASTGVYTINEAGTYRITLQLGMFPNTTAATRLCCGIYSGAGVSGERLALGVQAVTSLSANNMGKVSTVMCEHVGEFAAGDRVTVGAFADVASAKVLRNNTSRPDLSYVAFERLGSSGGASSYADLSDKPTVNGVELTGDLSLSDLGIQPATTPADTAWAYLAGSSSSANWCRWRCKSGVVYVELNYDSGADISKTSKLYGTIPAGYRPAKVVTAACQLSVNNNNISSMWVTAGGEVGASGAATSTTIYGSLSYPLD